MSREIKHCPLKSLLFVKVWAAGGREDVRGEKVLQFNYVVCGEEMGADKQMAQMLLRSRNRVGRVGVGVGGAV